MSEVCVIGAGAWGVALAIQAARAGRPVTLRARDAEAARMIAGSRESRRLPGARLPEAVRVTDRATPAALTLIAVPMGALEGVRVPENMQGGGLLVACCKGMDGAGSLPLEVLARTHPGAEPAVLTGPNFAAEVAAGLPAACVVAAARPDAREAVAAALGTHSFRVYGNDDPVGAQVCGAAKNVIAIAAGVVIGAGLGENARAALVTRGLAEIARLAMALGGRADTARGLSGMGDLLLTCTGGASRNYRFGFALGRGDAVPWPMEVTVEGRGTASALRARAAGLDVPVCAAVADLVEGKAALPAIVARLLARPRRDE